MCKNIIIAALVLLSLAQFVFFKVYQSAGKSAFSTAVIRANSSIYIELADIKNLDEIKNKLETAKKISQGPYEYNNGSTDIYYRILDEISK